MNTSERIKELEDELRELRSQRQHEGAEKLANLVETLHATVAEAKAIAEDYGLTFDFNFTKKPEYDPYWDSSSNC